MGEGGERTRHTARLGFRIEQGKDMVKEANGSLSRPSSYRAMRASQQGPDTIDKTEVPAEVRPRTVPKLRPVDLCHYCPEPTREGTLLPSASLFNLVHPRIL